MMSNDWLWVLRQIPPIVSRQKVFTSASTLFAWRSTGPDLRRCSWTAERQQPWLWDWQGRQTRREIRGGRRSRLPDARSCKERYYALFTPLYRSTDRPCRGGAAVMNLSDSASFSSQNTALCNNMFSFLTYFPRNPWQNAKG